jgi:dUTP pyrophosphatase
MEVNIKLLSKTAKIPTRGSKYSAGMDLYADIDESIEIKPNETKKISTGIAIELPIYTFGAIVARSSMANNKGLAPSNKVGKLKFFN